MTGYEMCVEIYTISMYISFVSSVFDYGSDFNSSFSFSIFSLAHSLPLLLQVTGMY